MARQGRGCRQASRRRRRSPLSVTIRALEPGDAPALVRLLLANRAFLAPYEPDRPERFFTVAGQLERIAALTLERESDASYAAAILDRGELSGTLILAPIVRGAAQSATVGYWVGRHAGGRGVATAAVTQIVRIAFEDLGLHRVDSATLVDNVASQRVLEKAGFERTGFAPRYLHINGQWRDHLLFHLLAD